MVKKIIQIADLHIPNSNEKRPYDQMLESFLKQLYVNEIKDQNPEEIRIVVCGDTFKNKIKTTNEAKAMFHTLLNYLNEMCRTYIFAGNHDMLENNHDRMDSINPTFEIEGVYENIVYLDKYLDFKSGYVEDENIVFALYSMHDNFAPTNVEHDMYPDHKIVGLYHGDVKGAVTDVGRMTPDGIDTSLFSECDCVMAGHIHKFQDIERDGVHIVYASSLFQQNSGENTTGHGYIVWDVETLEYKHVEVENNYRIFKFRVQDYDTFANDNETLVNL